MQLLRTKKKEKKKRTQQQINEIKMEKIELKEMRNGKKSHILANLSLALVFE